MKVEERIIEELNKIKPFLESDGGSIEFVKFEKGVAYVRLLGMCSHCPMVDITLKEGIEETLVNAIPEVIKVEQI